MASNEGTIDGLADPMVDTIRALLVTALEADMYRSANACATLTFAADASAVGEVIAAGSVVTAGGESYTVDSDVEIEAAGEVAVHVTAVNPGAVAERPPTGVAWTIAAPPTGVTAIASAASAAVAGFGFDPVAGHWSAPLENEIIGALRLPFLAVWVDQEDEADIGEYDEVSEVNVNVAYVLPATPRDKFAKRWPVLRHVWRKISRTIRQGWHPDFGEMDEFGADPLTLYHMAGVERVSRSGVKYMTTSGRSRQDSTSLYAMFKGRFTVSYNASAVDEDARDCLLTAFDVSPIACSEMDAWEVMTNDVDMIDCVPGDQVDAYEDETHMGFVHAVDENGFFLVDENEDYLGE